MTRSVAEKMAEVEADLSGVKTEIAKLKELLEKKFKCRIDELRLKWDFEEETNPVIGAQLAKLDALEKKELLLLEKEKDLRSTAAAAGENQRTILVEDRKA